MYYVFAVTMFLAGLSLIVFTKKYYSISWYSKNEVAESQEKMIMVSIKTIGVLIIFIAIRMFTLALEMSSL